MLNTRVYSVFVCSLLFATSLSATAFAADDPPEGTPANATPATATTSATAAMTAQGDDDATLRPAEPDYRLINLPTTLPLPRFKGNFDLTHRFAGNFRRGSLADQASGFFGLDQGAVVGFEYRMGMPGHVEAAAFRTAFGRTIQLYSKWDGIRQKGSLPFSASPIVSVEGQDNLSEQFAPAVGVTVSRMFGDLAALYAVPMWVHNTASALSRDDDTTFIGVGGRLRVRDTVYFTAEVTPRVAGFAPGDAEFAFAIEKRAGGHMFQLNVSNTSGTTFAQTARGGQPNNLALGFNLARKFF
jgi:hypothetical protein